MLSMTKGGVNMWKYNYLHPDELMHYGVLGMKWGHRKARRYENKARIARESAKEWREIGYNKASKLANKGKNEKATKIKNKYSEYAKKDMAASKRYEQKAKTKYYDKASKKTRTAVEKMSTGKAITSSMLLGSYGSLVYTSLRKKGVSRGKAAGRAIINNTVNNATFGKLSKKARW